MSGSNIKCKEIKVKRDYDNRYYIALCSYVICLEVVN